MPDREKVIKGLEMCTSIMDGDTCPGDCPYIRDVCYGYNQLMCDALALLKEQEPKFVEIDGQFGGIKYGRCPKCGKGLNEEVYPHWCGFCGQGVKWE